MLAAVTDAVAEKGYGRVTVADVVARASVSRTTFYEQFADREACFLAAYETGCEALIRTLVDAALARGADAGWEEMLEASIEAYLGWLAEEPAFARTFLVDILGAGPAAVALRRRVHEQFAAQFVFLACRAADEEPGLTAVPEIYLHALVGGIAELVHNHLTDHDAASLPTLAPVLVQFARSVIRGAGVRAGRFSRVA